MAKTRDMIVRRFTKTNSGTLRRVDAELEFPAAWSNKRYYLLVVKDEIGNEVSREQSKTYDTPELARQAAIEREREALKNGWVPRMADMAATGRATICEMYDRQGRNCNIDIVNVEITRQAIDDHWNRGNHYGIARFGDVEIAITGRIKEGSDPDVLVGTSFLLVENRPALSSKLYTGILVTNYWIEAVSIGSLPEVFIDAVPQELDQAFVRAYEAGQDRESIIQEFQGYLDIPGTTILSLTGQLQERISEPSERVRVAQEIIRRRSEAQQRERLAAEAASEARLRTAAQILRAQQSGARPRASGYQQPMFDSKASEEAKKRLTGGIDLTKPLKRKINLGDQTDDK